MKLWKIIITLALAVMVFGCTEMSREEKNLCFSLASMSHAEVPECSSESRCFKEAEKIIEADDLGHAQRGKMYELKNRLGRSWYYFNLAEEEAEKISSYCSAGNAAELPGAVNQARFYFDSSFLELDKALETSFEIIAYEEKRLSEEEIDLVKEEPLFDSLVEFRQILSELENGATNSDTYVSYYMNRAESFDSAGGNRGFDNLVEKRPFWVKAYYYFLGGRKKEERKAEFPFIHQIFKKSMNVLENRVYYMESIGALKNYPLHKFMKLYSDLGGNKDSAIKRFAELASRTNRKHSLIEREKRDLWKATSEKEAECRAIERGIKESEEFVFIKKKIPGISTSPSPEKRLGKLSAALVELRKKKADGSLSLGKEILTLKELRNGFEEVKAELEQKRDEGLEQLEEFCDNRASEMEDIEGEGLEGEVERIRESVVFHSKNVLASEGREKLLHCEKALAQYEDFRQAVEDYEGYVAEKADSTRECFEYLEKVFSHYELAELESNFNALKSEPVTEENFGYFEEACESIRRQAKKELEDDKELGEIVGLYKELLGLKNKLQKVREYSGKESAEDALGKAEAFLGGMGPYFPKGEPAFAEMLTVRKELKESLSEIVEKLTLSYEELAVQYIKGNATITNLGEKVPEAGQAFESKSRLTITNPFWEVEDAVVFETREEITKIESSIGRVQNKTTIYLPSVKKGTTTIDFISSGRVDVEEKFSLVAATNLRSLFKKSFSLTGNKIFPRLKIRTQKPKNTAKTIIIVDKREIAGSTGEEVSFVVKNAGPETRIGVFFYVEGLVGMEKEVEKRKKLYGGKEEITYKISAKNNHSEEIKATLRIPFQTNGFVEDVKVFDESMTEERVSEEKEELVLKKQSFLPQEERTYYIIAEINNSEEYYFSVLEELRDELVLLGDREAAEEIDRFLGIEFEEENKDDAEALIKRSQKRIEELSRRREEEAEREMLREEVEEGIEELEERITEFLELGLGEQAREAENAIRESQTLLESESIEDLASAQDLLESLSFSVEEELEAEAEEMAAWTQSIEAETGEIEALRESFFEAYSRFSRLVAFEPEKARRSFSSMKESYSLIKAKREELSERQKEKEDKAKALVKKLVSDIKRKVGFIKQQYSADAKELTEARFVPPITESRLKKIGLRVTEIVSKEISAEEKAEMLEKYLKELDDSIISIKSQAVSKFNYGVEEGFSKGVLAKGKELIDNNKYTFALLALNQSNAESFSSFPFLAFLPIILIAAIALVLREKVRREKKSKESKKSEVVSSWED